MFYGIKLGGIWGRNLNERYAKLNSTINCRIVCPVGKFK
jgi:hypothetical protein